MTIVNQYSEILKIISELKYWVKEFDAQVKDDHDKRSLELASFPKRIFEWNNKTKNMLNGIEGSGDFYIGDEKIMALENKLASGFGFSFALDFHYTDERGVYHPSEFEMFLEVLIDKSKALKAIVNTQSIINQNDKLKINFSEAESEARVHFMNANFIISGLNSKVLQFFYNCNQVDDDTFKTYKDFNESFAEKISSRAFSQSIGQINSRFSEYSKIKSVIMSGKVKGTKRKEANFYKWKTEF